ncbi:MAG: TIGR04282 family arsenosugar biosynthesis glycosyltransferase [Solirubrobacteraceae bacterium]|nr:TIGR04282 family arsenosugar biosynthesis glycosyltransferase [Solirubrobacteraceae bacterium]
MRGGALIVIAKAPVPGRVKTRLCPPCTPEQAAALAEAALADTLAAVARTPAARKVCVLDGEPGRWLPGGFEVVPQRGAGLDERLASAFQDVGGPALLVGMDTPQLTPTLLGDGLDALGRPGVDAVLGLAPDGGYWAVGLRRADRELFEGVPMSTSRTGAAQRTRLLEAGLRVRLLPELRDVDTIADAHVVAREAPRGGLFAAALAGLGHPAVVTP